MKKCRALAMIISTILLLRDETKPSKPLKNSSRNELRHPSHDRLPVFFDPTRRQNHAHYYRRLKQWRPAINAAIRVTDSEFASLLSPACVCSGATSPLDFSLLMQPIECASGRRADVCGEE